MEASALNNTCFSQMVDHCDNQADGSNLSLRRPSAQILGITNTIGSFKRANPDISRSVRREYNTGEHRCIWVGPYYCCGELRLLVGLCCIFPEGHIQNVPIAWHTCFPVVLHTEIAFGKTVVAAPLASYWLPAS